MLRLANDCSGFQQLRAPSTRVVSFASDISFPSYCDEFARVTGRSPRQQPSGEASMSKSRILGFCLAAVRRGPKLGGLRFQSALASSGDVQATAAASRWNTLQLCGFTAATVAGCHWLASQAAQNKELSPFGGATYRRTTSWMQPICARQRHSFRRRPFETPEFDQCFAGSGLVRGYGLCMYVEGGRGKGGEVCVACNLICRLTSLSSPPDFLDHATCGCLLRATHGLVDIFIPWDLLTNHAIASFEI